MYNSTAFQALQPPPVEEIQVYRRWKSYVNFPSIFAFIPFSYLAGSTDGEEIGDKAYNSDNESEGTRYTTVTVQSCSDATNRSPEFVDDVSSSNQKDPTQIESEDESGSDKDGSYRTGPDNESDSDVGMSSGETIEEGSSTSQTTGTATSYNYG